MKKLLVISLIGMMISISSCAPEFDIDPLDTAVNEEITMENLVVSPEFDWKTFTDVQLTLTGNSNNIIEVVSADGLVYQKAYLTKDNTYNMKLAVPTHETSVQLLYNNLEIPIDISSGYAEYKFGSN